MALLLGQPRDAQVLNGFSGADFGTVDGHVSPPDSDQQSTSVAPLVVRTISSLTDLDEPGAQVVVASYAENQKGPIVSSVNGHSDEKRELTPLTCREAHQGVIATPELEEVIAREPEPQVPEVQAVADAPRESLASVAAQQVRSEMAGDAGTLHPGNRPLLPFANGQDALVDNVPSQGQDVDAEHSCIPSRRKVPLFSRNGSSPHLNTNGSGGQEAQFKSPRPRPSASTTDLVNPGVSPAGKRAAMPASKTSPSPLSRSPRQTDRAIGLFAQLTSPQSSRPRDLALSGVPSRASAGPTMRPALRPAGFPNAGSPVPYRHSLGDKRAPGVAHPLQPLRSAVVGSAQPFAQRSSFNAMGTKRTNPHQGLNSQGTSLSAPLGEGSPKSTPARSSSEGGPNGAQPRLSSGISRSGGSQKPGSEAGVTTLTADTSVGPSYASSRSPARLAVPVSQPCHPRTASPTLGAPMPSFTYHGAHAVQGSRLSNSPSLGLAQAAQPQSAPVSGSSPTLPVSPRTPDRQTRKASPVQAFASSGPFTRSTMGYGVSSPSRTLRAEVKAGISK